MNHPVTTTATVPHTLADLMSPIDVSRYLGVPPGTLANWRYLGRGPAFLRVGRHVRYRAADVTAWVEDQITGRAQRSGPEQGSGAHTQLRHARR
jgi:helix-turn-helix protein